MLITTKYYISERSREAFSAKIEKNIKKKKKNTDEEVNEEEEIENQKKMQRVANFQARSAKNKMKPKKMSAMADFGQGLWLLFIMFSFYLILHNVSRC